MHALAAHPSQPDVAAGFGSGKLRIFHVPTTSLIQEFQLHEDGISEVRVARAQHMCTRTGVRPLSQTMCP